MNISNLEEKNGTLTFDLDGVLLPVVNGIRRTILSDITVVGIKGFPHEDCDINIIENDTNLNNEIIKHRITCIPIHVLKTDKPLWKKLKVVLNVQNETDQIIPVTTENITIIQSESGNEISESLTRKIFPPDPITKDHVLICYLAPVSDKMKKPNQIYFEATFSVLSPKVNSVYNCVSKATFSNTIDVEKQEFGWAEFQKTLSPESNMEKEKQNWKALKGQHYYKENSFNFTIKSIGFYSNKEILQKACTIISRNLDNISKKNGITIQKSKKTVMENAYDIIIENHSYTIGNILKKIIYDNNYGKDVTYVGFIVEHPHDSFSILRIVYGTMVDEEYVMRTLSDACAKSIDYIQGLSTLFEQNI